MRRCKEKLWEIEHWHNRRRSSLRAFCTKAEAVKVARRASRAGAIIELYKVSSRRGDRDMQGQFRSGRFSRV